MPHLPSSIHPIYILSLLTTLFMSIPTSPIPITLMSITSLILSISSWFITHSLYSPYILSFMSTNYILFIYTFLILESIIFMSIFSSFFLFSFTYHIPIPSHIPTMYIPMTILLILSSILISFSPYILSILSFSFILSSILEMSLSPYTYTYSPISLTSYSLITIHLSHIIIPTPFLFFLSSQTPHHILSIYWHYIDIIWLFLTTSITLSS